MADREEDQRVYLDEIEPPQEPSREDGDSTAASESTASEAQPSYLQQKGLGNSSSARWATLLEEDEALLQAIKSGKMTGAQWRDAMERQKEKRIQASAREEQRKAAAEAKESPQPTHTPKPARWRKTTFGLTPKETANANEAHNMWGELLDE